MAHFDADKAPVADKAGLVDVAELLGAPVADAGQRQDPPPVAVEVL